MRRICCFLAALMVSWTMVDATTAEEAVTLQQMLFRHAQAVSIGTGKGAVTVSCRGATKERKKTKRPYTISVSIQEETGQPVEIIGIQGFLFKNPSIQGDDDYQDLSGSLIEQFASSGSTGNLEANGILRFEDKVTAAVQVWLVYQVTGQTADGQSFTCYGYTQLSPSEEYVADESADEEASESDDMQDETTDDDWFYADSVTDESVSAAEEAAEAAENVSDADENE